MSTLVVLIVGMVALGLFETVLQFLRSYTLSHTTNRIDVELGRRLFHHLFRLPLAYFETRPAGQTVARMRELESIRSFLTGQGLTSLLDLVFTLVFIGVMFIYSAKLTLILLPSIPAYVAIAGVLRPVLREQINEKFNRGARSQQFLVESIVGAQTLKAAAVEPMMQAQWEERACLLRAHLFRCRSHRGAWPEPGPVREQGDDSANPVLRRAIGDRGLDVGRRTDRLHHDRQSSRSTDLAAVATLAGLSAGAGVSCAARRYPQFAARARAAESLDPAATAGRD
jgi:ABC-type multidrug transport system fused ATPase/permease subunit